jgi:c-di-GMP phosphodiesterase
MTSILQRLRQKLLGAQPEPSRAHGTLADKPTPSKVAIASLAPAPSTNAVPVLAGSSRRPLLANSGEIAGFEFCIDNAVLQRLGERQDHRGRAAYVAAALTTARLMAQSGRIGFARVPADWLVHLADAGCAAGTWVGVEPASALVHDPALQHTMTTVVAQLRAVGAKVGWDVTLGLEPRPDFVLLDPGSNPVAVLLQATKLSPPKFQGLPTLMTHVATVEDLELALGGGISFACGALAPREIAAAPAEIQPLSPEVRRVGSLLNQLVQGTDTAVIVSDIKSDVGLSYRLLRRMNSASYAQMNQDASIDQAVLMLGRNELYRWLSLLLLQFGGKRKVSSALQEITLWRSRLLELLATENKEAAPSQLFTLGLASMLSPLLKISLEDVVGTLNLPEAARQALLEQSGPWFGYLQVALQVEAQSLQDNPALAEPLGGVARIQALADEAWDWAWAAEHASRTSA